MQQTRPYDGPVQAALLDDRVLIVALSSTRSEGTPEPVTDLTDPAAIAARRHAVVVAVGRLTRPPGPSA